MKKEEFINLALNSELRVLTNDGSIEIIKGIIGGAYCITDFPKYGMYGDCIDANLILRPLSDLTKSIEHNGEKFVPIVELAKISWITEYVNFKFQSLKEESVFIAFSDKKNVFGYDSNAQSFFGGLDGEPCSVVNQLQLFQKLIEWHFDIAGLIEKGEAIDINTLPENPYK